MIEQFEIPFRISIFDVDAGRCGSVSCTMLNSWAKNSEVFQFKALVGTKGRNFVPFFLGSLILGPPVKTRPCQCGLEGNLVSS